MAELKLTKEQVEATESSGGSLLVSAAAGSGKTKVLVERLLGKILESDSEYDIDDFLIITYTNAAALELKNKILDAIFEKISDDPENRRLRRQADLCSRADIETIHSFCNKVIKENAHLLDITPDFRIMDDFEGDDLKLEVLTRLLEKEYEVGDEGFYMLVDTLGAGRDDSALVQIVLDMHTKLMSHPYPDRWVNEQIMIYSEVDGVDPMDTAWGRTILKSLETWTEYWLKKFGDVVKELDYLPDFDKAYGESIRESYAGLIGFSKAIYSGWDDARNSCMSITFPRAKGRGASGYEDLKAVRKDLIDEVKKLNKLFYADSRKVMDDVKATAPIVISLLKLTLSFDEKYSEEKQRRGSLDFSDQEHLALRLLVDEDSGESTTLAHSISERYCEIMIDEYQDVNLIQEYIFNAVSKSQKNVFMVGDVKQSIYQFRLADPTIFLKKYASYKDYEEAGEGEERKIILSKNFRSRPGILSAVNYVFTNIMSHELGEMDYTDREALYYGATYPEDAEPSVELDVIDVENEDDSAKPKNNVEEEARFASKRIKELVGKKYILGDNGEMRPVRYGDIAIIMRSPKSRAKQWLSVFEQESIPVLYESESEFFETVEISTLICLLATIDNPHQDIPLVSTLRSPIYRFTAEDLAEIRANQQDGDFYEAVLKESDTSKKCADFILSLNTFRKKVPEMPSDKFIWYVLDETDYIAYISAMPDGAKRRQNIMLLIEYAKKLENSGYKGLFEFINHMRKLMQSGKNLESSEGIHNENAVIIMSIHKSKGLEFPIVILADLVHQFNKEDLRKPVLIHPQLGAAAKFTDLERRLSYPTIARNAVSIRLENEGLSEEMRVLYVAMTRAKEKLIMLCTFKGASATISKLCNVELPVAPFILERAKSPAEWILMTALRRADSEEIREGISNVPANGTGEGWCIRLIKADEIEIPETEYRDEGIISEKDNKIFDIKERLEWSYAYINSLNIPSKVTATELKGSYSDAETHEEAEQIESIRKFLPPPEVPSFVEGEKSITAAQRGTATHLVMQYADYSKCLTVEGVKAEIDRLRDINNLTDEQANVVNPRAIAGFFSSDLGQDLLSATEIWRELKFSVLVDSGIISNYPEGEEILLQGVVDCCFRKEDKLVVIDFKTDYVTRETVEERAEYYRGQLEIYRIAMEKVLKMDVDSLVLYFLSAGISFVL